MLGLEVYLKYSPIMQPFWRWKHQERFNAIERAKAFYSRLLQGNKLNCIFDVGANVGDKTCVFKEFANLVVCVEPDPLSAQALRLRYGKGVVVEQVAVGEQEGNLVLYQKRGLSTMNTLDKELSNHWGENVRAINVAITTLDQLIQKHGTPDFMKLDVEGFELQVFNGLNTAIPPCCFEAFVPMFYKQTVQIINRLATDASGEFFNATELDSDKLIFSTNVSANRLLIWLYEQTTEASDKGLDLAYDIFYLPNSISGVPAIT